MDRLTGSGKEQHMKKANYEVFRHPLSRIGTVDLGQIGRRKHHIAGLLEVDVTEAIAQIRKLRAEGREISFFAWMVKAISTAIVANRYIHALTGRKHHTVVFEDIDISIMLEKVVEGNRVPLPLLIRKTNEKTEEAIYAEIQEAQSQNIKDESDYVLTENKLPRTLMRLYYTLPQWVRLSLIKQILINPHRTKAMMGTAIITSVGTAGHVSGWIIPKAMHNLCFALGPIAKKPWVVANRIEIRDILHLTVLVDHDVVDGAPAARFVARLLGRIQKVM
jgi:pyruvate/2-oxoglutarate dehydrogenase complex dihydrolipoamide acyltransferase (E2) component